MGLFGKKKERGVGEYGYQNSDEPPQLPELPPLPDIDYDSPGGAPELPSFPNSPTGERFNQSAVKEAVMDEGQENYEEPAPEPLTKPQGMPPTPRVVRTREMGSGELRTREIGEERMPSKPLPGKMAFPQPRPMQIQRPPIRIIPKSSGIEGEEPLFVRLDKFEDAISSFNEIRLRVSEIESLLRDIKNLKEKEESELREWERELNSLKERISEIDKDIFSKI